VEIASVELRVRAHLVVALIELLQVKDMLSQVLQVSVGAAEATHVVDYFELRCGLTEQLLDLVDQLIVRAAEASLVLLNLQLEHDRVLEVCERETPGAVRASVVSLGLPQRVLYLVTARCNRFDGTLTAAFVLQELRECVHAPHVRFEQIRALGHGQEVLGDDGVSHVELFEKNEVD